MADNRDNRDQTIGTPRKKPAASGVKRKKKKVTVATSAQEHKAMAGSRKSRKTAAAGKSANAADSRKSANADDSSRKSVSAGDDSRKNVNAADSRRKSAKAASSEGKSVAAAGKKKSNTAAAKGKNNKNIKKKNSSAAKNAGSRSGSKQSVKAGKKKGKNLWQKLLIGTVIIVAMVVVIALTSVAHTGIVASKEEDNGIVEVVASEEVLHLSFPQLVVDEAYDAAVESIEAKEAEKAASENEDDEYYDEEEETETTRTVKRTDSGNASMTVSDFNEILQQLYDDQYVLVDFYSIVSAEEDGMKAAEITVPAGKKPLVISQRNVTYSEEEAQEGHATELLYENGSFSNKYVMPETLDDQEITNIETSEAENSIEDTEVDSDTEDSEEDSSYDYEEDSSYDSEEDSSYDADEDTEEDSDADLMTLKGVHPLTAELANVRVIRDDANAVLVTDTDIEETDTEDSEYAEEEETEEEEEAEEEDGDADSAAESEEDADDDSADSSVTGAGKELTGNFDVITCLDAFIAAHPDFSYNNARGVLAVTGENGVLGCAEEDAAQAKEKADALKAEGWRFASYSYANVSYGSELAIVEADSENWEEKVESLVGETDILLLPGKADIGPWSGYTESNERFQCLKEKGFRYFCIHNNESLFYMQAGEDYARLGMHEVKTKNEFSEIMKMADGESDTSAATSAANVNVSAGNSADTDNAASV